ncbi:MAG: hypothetical protein HYU64_15575 [Armatimonadetes bacterium]|nr:hypothetical protein [Armatimonadota bacterium]
MKLLRTISLSAVLVFLFAVGTIVEVAASQKTAQVPVFKENEDCLTCHKSILDVKTGKKQIVAPHKKHLESKKMEYKGEQRKCLTCHEAYTAAKRGERKPGFFVKGGIFHPNTDREPKAFWRRTIQRPDTHGNPPLVEAVHPESPYLFKTSLSRLVCVKCHGPDSKVKTFYGTPAH